MNLGFNFRDRVWGIYVIPRFGTRQRGRGDLPLFAITGYYGVIMELAVYLVILPTGLVTDDGVESVIVLDVKLTYASAQIVAKEYDGARIEKRKANKSI